MIFCKNAVLLVLALCSSVAAFSPSSPSAVSVRNFSIETKFKNRRKVFLTHLFDTQRDGLPSFWGHGCVFDLVSIRPWACEPERSNNKLTEKQTRSFWEGKEGKEKRRCMSGLVSHGRLQSSNTYHTSSTRSHHTDLFDCTSRHFLHRVASWSDCSCCCRHATSRYKTSRSTSFLLFRRSMFFCCLCFVPFVHYRTKNSLFKMISFQYHAPFVGN